MSEENVEIVRRVYVALTQGDGDTLRDLAVPEFVVDFSRRLVEPGVLRGRDEAIAPPRTERHGNRLIARDAGDATSHRVRFDEKVIELSVVPRGPPGGESEELPGAIDGDGNNAPLSHFGARD
jgi:ketosteroid isomerase-like protein